MKKLHYRYIPQNLYQTDIGAYASYGITLKNDPNVIVNDVSCEKKVVKRIGHALNRYQADPVHLTDVIEDMLG
ncbi:MAG: hypothetical protein KH354_08545, partial [Clostridiales bacterium]|nr:hypothetical protein [Clostridiales bacterium]